jgi:hypothetical protein
MPFLVLELGQLDHPGAKIGEAHRQRIELRPLLVQQDADVFGVRPFELVHGVGVSRGSPERIWQLCSGPAPSGPTSKL